MPRPIDHLIPWSDERPRLGQILLAAGWIDDVQLARALAHQHALPFVAVEETPSDPATLEALPEHIAAACLALPLSRASGGATVAVADPSDPETTEALREVFGASLHLVVAAASALARAIDERYRAVGGAEESGYLLTRPKLDDDDAVPRAEDTVTGAAPIWDDLPIRAEDHLGGRPAAPPARSAEAVAALDGPREAAPDTGDPPEADDDGGAASTAEWTPEAPLTDPLPIPEAITSLPALVMRLGAAPTPEQWTALCAAWIANGLLLDCDRAELRFVGAGATLRWRHAGTWVEAGRLPAAAAGVLRARLLAAAGVSAADHDTAWVGRPVALEGTDARASLAPTEGGPADIGVRLLRAQPLQVLDDLALGPELARRLKQWAAARDGLVVVCGPPGSGRTTTLRALAASAAEWRPTTFVGEPPTAGDTPFEVVQRPGGALESLQAAIAGGGRVLVLDDADDPALAALAASEVARGRVVMLGVRARDAADALIALQSAGVPDTALGPALLGVVEQVAVRLLCPACESRGDLDVGLARTLGLVADTIPSPVAVRGPGCPQCLKTGFRGRRILATRVELGGGSLGGLSVMDLRAQVDAGRKRSPAEVGLAMVVQRLTSLQELATALGVGGG